jgi:hypothetical protein
MFPSNSLPTINFINPLVSVLIVMLVMSDNLEIRPGMDLLFALPWCYNGLLDYCHVVIVSRVNTSEQVK